MQKRARGHIDGKLSQLTMIMENDFSQGTWQIEIGSAARAQSAASFRLETDEISRYGQAFASFNLPTLLVMEGSYAVEEVGINSVNALNGVVQS